MISDINTPPRRNKRYERLRLKNEIQMSDQVSTVSKDEVYVTPS